MSEANFLSQSNFLCKGSNQGNLQTQKQFLMTSGILLKGQNAGFEIDLQQLLERQSLNETWNKLLKHSLLSSDHPDNYPDSFNNRIVGNLAVNFPCACCDRDCDLKCQISGLQSPDSIQQATLLTKYLKTWLWNKEIGMF